LLRVVGGNPWFCGWGEKEGTRGGILAKVDHLREEGYWFFTLFPPIRSHGIKK